MPEAPDHPDERLLHEILRERVVPGQQIGEPARRGRVALVQVGEAVRFGHRKSRLGALQGTLIASTSKTNETPAGYR